MSTTRTLLDPPTAYSSTSALTPTLRAIERRSGFDTPAATASGTVLRLASQPNTTVTSVPVEESLAFPTQDGHVRYADQPEGWASQIRGMPRYRPLNRDLDPALRPLGADNGQRFFLTFMLSGVLVQEMANRVWRSTIGRFPIAESWFVFKIGGQW